MYSTLFVFFVILSRRSPPALSGQVFTFKGSTNLPLDDWIAIYHRILASSSRLFDGTAEAKKREVRVRVRFPAHAFVLFLENVSFPSLKT